MERLRGVLRVPGSEWLQGSLNRRIAHGFLFVSLFVLLGKLAGAAKEIAVAWRYGVSERVDAYILLFNLVNWPVSIWFGVLTVVLVPLVAKLRQQHPTELARFQGQLIGLSVLLGAVMAATMYVVLHFMLRAGSLRLQATTLDIAESMLPGLSCLAFFGTVISVLSAWTLAMGKHRNTLLEGVPALALMVAILLPGDWVPEPLVWGTVIGFGLHAASLAWPMKRHGQLARPTLAFSSPGWSDLWPSLRLVAAGQVLTTSTTLIDQFFAAGLGTGVLSTLGYANRLLALILGMGAVAISRATLPIFSSTYIDSPAQVRKLAIQWAGWLFLGGCILVIGVSIAAPSIVKLVFERGSFNPSDTQAVAAILRYALLQVPFYFAGLVLVSALSAGKQYRAITLSAVLNLCVKFCATYLLTTNLQLPGLVLSTGVMYAVSALFLLVSMRRTFDQ